MALRARCLSIGFVTAGGDRWRRGWRFGLMRLYAEMACARPANVGPRLAIADLLCVNNPPPVQQSSRSAVSVRGGRQVVGEQACYRLAVPGRLSAARAADRRRCSFLHLLWRAMHRIDKSSKHGRGRAMPKGECPLRSSTRPAMRRPDGMDWTSQLQLGLHTQPNLTGVRPSDCYAQVSNVAGIDGGLSIKVGSEAVQSQLPALPAAKNKRSAPMPASLASAWDCSDLSSAAC